MPDKGQILLIFHSDLGAAVVKLGKPPPLYAFAPSRAIQRQVAAAIAPQVPPNASSQIVSEMNDPAGGMRSVSNANQGTNAPIEKACRAPRSNNAMMIRGVGTTHHTSEAKTAMPSEVLRPSRIATAVTKISIQARLN